MTAAAGTAATREAAPAREEGGVLAATESAAAETQASSLPFTGLDVGVIGGAGLILLLGGFIGRRAARLRA